MSETPVGVPSADSGPAPAAILEREAGLHRSLTPGQLAMIGIGSTIGTGLFLGSAISVKLAGPAVILSFVGAAGIALTMMWALAEMAAAHPAAGSFGLYAEMYLHPWAGFAIRLTYWLCILVVVGSEVVAASIYCKLWFPETPAWIWIAMFSLLILYVNTVSIGNLGIFEYVLSMIKVVTIVAFLIFGTALLTGVGFPKLGLANYTAHGGFLPHGWKGVAMGIVMGLFSFFGIEVVGSTAGEAADPKVATFLCRRTRARRRDCSVDADRAGRESVRACLSNRGNPGSESHHEFRGADGGALQRRRQFVFRDAAGFFAGSRWLSSFGNGTIEWQRYAGDCSFGLGMRNGGGAFPLSLFRRLAFCFHGRVEQLWGAVRVADDAAHAPGVPSLPQTASTALPASGAARALGIPGWIHGGVVSVGIHLVGAGISRHLAGGPALARRSYGVLPCVEESPLPQAGQWRVARWMNF
jgi:hypothetical protein